MRKLKHLFMLGLFCMISIGASAEVYSGSCGDNAQWSFDTTTGLLSITGSGKMKDYDSSSDVPWYSYKRGITSLSIGNGITSIGKYTFYNYNFITSVTVPNSVTSIGDYAFDTCSNLASVIIGNSVTSISESAFGYCSSLTSIKVVSGNMIYDSRDNCNAIIETASNTLICGCKNTTIPNSVTSIGDDAFCGSGLTTVTIPNSVTSIGRGAFQNSRSLTSVSIPNSVTSIGSAVFFGCSGLASITVESDNTIYDSRDNCNAIIETASNTLISGCQNTTIPNSVTSIGLFAFYGSSGLTSVTIPNSVTSIGDYAFSDCSGLTSVTIPNSVTSIGWFAFDGCSGLTSVYVEWKDAGKIPSIDNSCFPFSTCDLYAPTGIKTIYQNKEYWRTFRNIYEYEPETEPTTDIPNDEIWYTSRDGNVVSPKDSGGFGATIISNTYTDGKGIIKFAGNVTSIGKDAFWNCTDLTSVTIPNSVTSVGNRAFSGCSGLTNPVYNNTIFAKMPTSYSGSYSIPDGITTIADNAFSGCSRLTSVTIPNSVTLIGNDAFRDCSGLTSVTIPNSVTEIGSYAFSHSSSLTSVTIGNSVTSIGEAAFFDCSGLTSVTIPNSVTSIGNSVFASCSSLTSIAVESGNKVYDSRDNCNAIIETASNTLICGCKNTTIPNSVTSIGNDAFIGCSLTSVTIPNSVTSIGGYAFYGSGLTSVTIPNSVTSIGLFAFYGSSGLTRVYVEWKDAGKIPSLTSDDFPYSTCDLYVPTGVRTIYQSKEYWSTFRNIYEYEPETEPTTDIPNDEIWYTSRDGNVVTPYSDVFGASIVSNTYTNGKGVIKFNGNVTSIGESAFYGRSGLTSVTIPNSVTSIGNYAFRYCSGLTSVTIGNSVTSIGKLAFSGCSGLTSVTIPNSVTSIGSEAFADCSGLTSVTIPNSVSSIGNWAFSGCSDLTSVTIPNSVTSIGQEAFSGCSGLTSVTIPNSVTSIGNWAFAGCYFQSGKFVNNSSLNAESNNYWGATICDTRTDDGLCIIYNMVVKYCGNGTSVTIPNSVTSIGWGAFSGCSGLTSVTIPNSVTSIWNYAFSGCSGLASVTIPNSVTSIGGMAFSDCSGLTRVYVEWKDAGKIPSLTSDDFPYTTCDLYVPTGVRTIYQSKEYWSTFRNIYEYEPESGLLGDANDDGSVNVNDISTIAAYILEDSPQPFVFENADANGDGVVNVNDISATATIILDGEGGGEGGDSQVYLKCPDNHHPHVIDLGLPSGTKWCCCNVGATTPEGYGGYYAWGETSEKSYYDWDTYAYWQDKDGDGCVDSGECTNIGSDIAGTQYDVAHVSMGGSWRMPSHDQQMELMNNCTRTWTQQNGVNGILVTGKNGGQIFLPAAGDRWYDDLCDAGSCGYYWSSSLRPDFDIDAFSLGFYSGSWFWDYSDRDSGRSVRAVCP